MFIRISTLTVMTIASLMAAGCCCDPCGGMGGCGSCDDGYGHTMAYGPLDGLRRLRKRAVCGAGCGDVYHGEWRSYPPDACDPCCGGEFVGGAVPCHGGCGWHGWSPGHLIRALYGKRFCGECGHGVADCCCGEAGFSEGMVIEPDCGCASCDSAAPVTTRMATQTRMQRTSKVVPAQHQAPVQRTAGTNAMAPPRMGRYSRSPSRR